MTISAIRSTSAPVPAAHAAPPAVHRAVPSSRPMAPDALEASVPRAATPAHLNLAAPAAASGGVDFTRLFQGFQIGGQLKISSSLLLAGGSATLRSLSRNSLHLSGNVSILGLVNEPINIELKQQRDGTFRMTGSATLRVALQQSGNRITITDLDAPTHKVHLTATKPGVITVRTEGMGYDMVTAKVKAR